MSEKVKPFAQHGHYTAVHDAVFDVVMPYCPPNAFKVLLFVLRKTRGWKKDEDVLRYAEIKAGTGIKSDTTLSKELEWLRSKKLLNARNEDGTPHEKGDRRAPAYSLNRDFELKVSTPENEVGATPENGASNNQLSQEPNVEANASSAKGSAKAQSGRVIGTEKYLTDRIYEAMREAKLRLPNTDFTFHLGRCQDMLEKDEPMDEELDMLPAAFVRLWKIKGRADAPAALVEMRRQRARVEVLSEDQPTRMSTARRKQGYEWLFDDEPEPKRDLDAELKAMRESA